MSRLTTVGESAALSRELSGFLIEFSIGLRKKAIYPSQHPLRDQVHRFVSGWNLEDQNPDNYRKALEKMSQQVQTFRGEDSFAAEPERLLSMELEIEILRLDSAPDRWMKTARWTHVATPVRLETQLEE